MKHIIFITLGLFLINASAARFVGPISENGRYVVTSEISDSSTDSVLALCDAGDKIVTGGCSVTHISMSIISAIPVMSTLEFNTPTTLSEEGFECVFSTDETISTIGSKAKIICEK